MIDKVFFLFNEKFVYKSVLYHMYCLCSNAFEYMTIGVADPSWTVLDELMKKHLKGIIKQQNLSLSH